MKISSGIELLAEIKRYMYLNGYTNETIAQNRKVSKQNVHSFFNSNTKNPTINSVLETLNALDAELHIEIIKKDKDEK